MCPAIAGSSASGRRNNRGRSPPSTARAFTKRESFMCYRISNITRKRIISARVIISGREKKKGHSLIWKNDGNLAVEQSRRAKHAETLTKLEVKVCFLFYLRVSVDVGFSSNSDKTNTTLVDLRESPTHAHHRTYFVDDFTYIICWFPCCECCRLTLTSIFTNTFKFSAIKLVGGVDSKTVMMMDLLGEKVSVSQTISHCFAFSPLN